MRVFTLQLALLFSIAFCQFQLAWADSYVENYNASVNLYNEGNKYLLSGDPNHAIECFQKAIEKRDFADARVNYGVACSALGKHDEAVEQFKKATTLEPSKPSVWQNLAVGYQSKGDLSSCAKAYEHYLQLNPRAADGANVRAWLSNYRKGAMVADPNSNGPDYVASIRAPLNRWNLYQMPIRVFVASGNGVPGFMPQFLDLVPAAFNDWSRGMQGKLSFTPVQNRNDAQITIDWTNNPSTLRDASEGGETEVWGMQGQIQRVTIKLLTNNPTQTIKMTPQIMSWKLYHEIGHALGLSGHSPNADDLMYYNCSMTSLARYAVLSNRDLTTLAKYYGCL